jgi:predicted histidine transporter YuiF (NhaC family)
MILFVPQCSLLHKFWNKTWDSLIDKYMLYTVPMMIIGWLIDLFI